MMCKTGCGAEAIFTGEALCAACCESWTEVSLEVVRYRQASTSEARDIAFVDFCTRRRAERLNGGHGDAR